MTFDSSSATLTLPAGSSVLWAGLYWSGDTAAPGIGSAAPTPAANNTVQLKGPGGGRLHNAHGGHRSTPTPCARRATRASPTSPHR